jgi:hypothetical protein
VSFFFFFLEFERRQGEGRQRRLRYAMFHAQAEKMNYYIIPASNGVRDLSPTVCWSMTTDLDGVVRAR